MTTLSNFFINTIIDQVFRGQPSYTPANTYAGLLLASEGVHATSTVYPAASYMTVEASDLTYHLYYTVAGGTSASSAPTFPGTANETISDGTITWVEQNSVLKANGAAVSEVTIGYGAYGRPTFASTLADWAGTQGSGTTTPSTGTSGTTTNNVAITYPAPTANWAAAPSIIWAVALFDAASGGNLIAWAPVTLPTTILNGASAPIIPISDLSFNLS